MRPHSFAALAVALTLASCGSIPQVTGDSRTSLGVQVDDSKASVEVQKKITEAKVDPVTGEVISPERVAWTPGDSGMTSFVFQARPGSDAAYITGYRILSDRVGGVERGATIEARDRFNIYVGSGFGCLERNVMRSCTTTDSQMSPENGLPSQPLLLDLTSVLVNEVIENDRTTGRAVDIEFFGTSSTGKPVSVVTQGVVSVGIKKE